MPKDFSIFKELLSSPLVLVLIVVLMIFSPTLYRYFSRRKKCEYCNEGYIRETEVKPIGSAYFDDTKHSTSVVRVEVTYRCTHCSEFKVVIENR